MKSVEVPDDLKLPDNFTHLDTEIKENKYDAKEFAVILKGMVCRLPMVSMILFILSSACLVHMKHIALYHFNLWAIF